MKSTEIAGVLLALIANQADAYPSHWYAAYPYTTFDVIPEVTEDSHYTLTGIYGLWD